MSTRMEKMESGVEKRKRQCRQMAETLRDGLNKIVMAHNAKVLATGKRIEGGSRRPRRSHESVSRNEGCSV